MSKGNINPIKKEKLRKREELLKRGADPYPHSWSAKKADIVDPLLKCWDGSYSWSEKRSSSLKLKKLAFRLKSGAEPSSAGQESAPGKTADLRKQGRAKESASAKVKESGAKLPLDIPSAGQESAPGKTADLQKQGRVKESASVAKIYHIAGRLMRKRLMGQTAFFNIQDESGDLQCYIKRDDFSSKWMAMEEAKSLVQKERIQTKKQFDLWKKKGKRPENFPPDPHTAYKNAGWLDYKDFFKAGHSAPNPERKNNQRADYINIPRGPGYYEPDPKRKNKQADCLSDETQAELLPNPERKNNQRANSWELWRLCDIGDILGLTGTLFITKKGEPSLRVKGLTILCKALEALPEKYHGLEDQELKYRYRHLDLIMDQKSREVFKIRSQIIYEIRSFMRQKGFMEVETPILQPIYGGALAQPFETYFRRLNQKMYLKISPEIYLKKLLVGGFEKVFEIGKNFRNEGIDRSHNPEFTMMEYYEAYTDYKDQIQLFESLVCHVADKINREREKKVTSEINREKDKNPADKINRETEENSAKARYQKTTEKILELESPAETRNLTDQQTNEKMLKFKYQGRELDLTPPWTRISLKEFEGLICSALSESAVSQAPKDDILSSVRAGNYASQAPAREDHSAKKQAFDQGPLKAPVKDPLGGSAEDLPETAAKGERGEPSFQPEWESHDSIRQGKSVRLKYNGKLLPPDQFWQEIELDIQQIKERDIEIQQTRKRDKTANQDIKIQQIQTRDKTANQDSKKANQDIKIQQIPKRDKRISFSDFWQTAKLRNGLDEARSLMPSSGLHENQISDLKRKLNDMDSHLDRLSSKNPLSGEKNKGKLKEAASLSDLDKELNQIIYNLKENIPIFSRKADSACPLEDKQRENDQKSEGDAGAEGWRALTGQIKKMLDYAQAVDPKVFEKFNSVFSYRAFPPDSPLENLKDELALKLLERTAEKYLWNPVFIMDFPLSSSPLTKKHREQSRFVERFEPYIAGMEIGNAYTELNDPVDQRERMEGQRRYARDEKGRKGSGVLVEEAESAIDSGRPADKNSPSKEKGFDPALSHPVDENFLHAVEVGMPPTGGAGLGVERLVMILTDQASIKDSLLFPILKNKP